MNKTVSRITAAALAAVMALGLSSCGKKNEAVIASKDHIFSAQKIELPGKLDYISKMLYSNDKLYIIGNRYTENPDLAEKEPEDVTNDGAEDEPVAVETAAATMAVVMGRNNSAVSSMNMSGVVTAVSVAETEAETEEPEDEVTDNGEDVSDDNADAATDDAVYDEPVSYGTNETLLQIVNMDGTLEKEVVLVSDDGTGGGGKNFTSFTLDNDGNIVAVENVYTWDNTTGESTNEYFIIKYDLEGNVISETNLEKLTEAVKEETGDDWFYVDYMNIADDGSLIMSGNNVISIADKDGNFKGIIKNETTKDDSWMDGPYKTGDGRFIVCVNSWHMEGDEYKSEQKLYELDITGMKLGAEYPYAQNGRLMNGTEKYDLLISKDSGLVGYDIETNTTETVIDWLKSGFDSTALQTENTTVLKDGRILCVGYDYKYNGGGGYSWGGNDLVINILTEVDPATLPDRKLIKIYAMYLDVDIRRQIVEFNKNNPEYEIEFTSYNEFATNSYDEAVTKLNNDMIAGNLPDIIILNESLPVDSYISKGLLADLYTFMDNDETINRGDFVESVFKAYETNGKLYELVPTFGLSTVIGKTSEVGDTPGWTAEEFMKLVDENPDKSVFGREMSRDGFFSMIINACYNNFINRETGECSFNSDDFIKLMEFANRLPKEVDYDALYSDENYYTESQAQYRNGKTLLSLESIDRFGRLPETEQGKFGEPITFKGYPGTSGNGAVFQSYTEIAITSKAANPDGAWQFVKYFLSEEYQDQFATNQSYTFPVRKSSLEKQAEASKERPYWEDDKGNKEYYDNSYWLGDSEIKIKVNTDEDNQRIMDLINGTTAVARYDTDITNIISEESAAYFEGQKTAEAVAEIIQNRVSNYIAENR